jgi:hypothetical protein
METVASDNNENVPATAQIAYNFTQEQMKDIWKHMNDNCNNKLFTLPKQTRYPAYYEEVKKPITLEQISNKIEAGNYDHSEDFVTDMKLISSNCIKYYSKWNNKHGKAAMEFEKLLRKKLLEYVEENESVEDSDTDSAGANNGNDGNGEQNDNTGTKDGSDNDDLVYVADDADADAEKSDDAENDDEEENEEENDDVGSKKGSSDSEDDEIVESNGSDDDANSTIKIKLKSLRKKDNANLSNSEYDTDASVSTNDGKAMSSPAVVKKGKKVAVPKKTTAKVKKSTQRPVSKIKNKYKGNTSSSSSSKK